MSKIIGIGRSTGMTCQRISRNAFVLVTKFIESELHATKGWRVHLTRRMERIVNRAYSAPTVRSYQSVRKRSDDRSRLGQLSTDEKVLCRHSWWRRQQRKKGWQFSPSPQGRSRFPRWTVTSRGMVS